MDLPGWRISVIRHHLINLLKYLLALGVLSFVIYNNWDPPSGYGLGNVWQKHVVERAPSDLLALGIGMVLYLIAVILTLIRWWVLVRAQSLPFTLSSAFRVGLIGFFYNIVLPGSVGGDIVKAAVLAREQSRRTVAVATVLMDRVIALWGLFWFVAILGSLFWAFGILDGPQLQPGLYIVRFAVLVVSVSVVVWSLLGLLPSWRAERFAGRLGRIPKVGKAISDLWVVIWMYRQRPSSVAIALVLSWIGHVNLVLSFFFCARVLWNGQPDNPLPTIAQHFLLVPIGLIVAAIPLFPGGMGIGEAGFGKLYDLFGSAQANGVLASLVQRVVSWIIGFVGFLSVRSGATLPATSVQSTVGQNPLNESNR